ncbi:hypothetical protein ACFL21_05130 [Patescibacteria group bacterium]
MQIRIQESTIQKILKVTPFFLLGIFLITIIFAVLINYFKETGIWLGLFISVLLILAGFYYTEKKTSLRYATWGMVITIVFCSAAFLSMLKAIEAAFEGF